MLSRGTAATAVTCCALLGAAAAAQVTAIAAVTMPATGAASAALPSSGATWGAPLLLPWSPGTDLGAGYDDAGSVSCTAPGDCGVAGSYGDSSFNDQAFIDDEKSGRWQEAREVPGYAALNAGGGGAAAISCASPGNCAVGGDYQQDVSGSVETEGFVASEVNGTWHDAAPVRGTVSANTDVNSVSCPAAGDCVAAGDFTDRAGNLEAFVADQSHGTWGSEITVAARLNVGGGASVSSVSCVSAGNCAAGGSYAIKSNRFEAFTVDERHGVWLAAHEVAGALNAGANAGINSVSCASPGNCVAGGSYTDRAGHTQAFLVTEKGGAWSAAQEVAGKLNAGGNATVNTVSCRSAGNCGAGGSYTATGKGTTPPNQTRQEAFVVSERHGVWSAAREVAGALNTAGSADLETISCPSAGDCAAGGYYSIGNGLGHGFVVTERGGTWLAASEMAANLDTFAGGSVDSISCVSVSDCTAGGAISDESIVDAFVVTGSIIEPTSTTLSLSAARVSYGHEQSARLSVTVRARYRGTPAGRVLVKAGAATVCVIVLKAGAGRCTLTARQLRAGTYNLTAAYGGSAGYLGSASARTTLTVTG